MFQGCGSSVTFRLSTSTAAASLQSGGGSGTAAFDSSKLTTKHVYVSDISKNFEHGDLGQIDHSIERQIVLDALRRVEHRLGRQVSRQEYLDVRRVENHPLLLKKIPKQMNNLLGNMTKASRDGSPAADTVHHAIIAYAAKELAGIMASDCNTEVGEMIYEDIQQHWSDKLEQIVEKLSPEEKEQLQAVIDEVSAAPNPDLSLYIDLRKYAAEGYQRQLEETKRHDRARRVVDPQEAQRRFAECERQAQQEQREQAAQLERERSRPCTAQRATAPSIPPNWSDDPMAMIAAHAFGPFGFPYLAHHGGGRSRSRSASSSASSSSDQKPWIPWPQYRRQGYQK